MTQLNMKEAAVDGGYKLFIKCEHRDEYLQANRIGAFHVVPDSADEPDRVTIKLVGTRDDPPPPQIAVTRRNRAGGLSEVPVHAHVQGLTGYYSFDTSYSDLLKLKVHSTEFKGDVMGTGDLVRILDETIGDRPDKVVYTIDKLPEPLKVYIRSPHTWALEFNIPAFQGLRRGGACGTSGSTSYSSVGADGGTVVRQQTGENAKGQIGEARFGIRVLRDGEEVEDTVIQVIKMLLDAVRQGHDIVKLIDKYSPKVGWYASIDLQIFVGLLTMTWVNVETARGGSFKTLELAGKLKIIGLTGELGFGFQALGGKLRLVLYIQAAINLDYDRSIKLSEKDPKLTLTASGTLQGGVKGDAGKYASVAAHVVTGINATLTFHAQATKLKVSWDGVKVVAQAEIDFGIKYEAGVTITLVEPGKIIERDLFATTNVDPQELDRSGISAVIARVFNQGGRDVEFHESYFSEISNDRVAAQLAERIEQDPLYPDLKRDMKSIEGLAFRMRTTLKEKYNEFGIVDIEPKYPRDLYRLMDNDLPAMLKDMIDPTKQMARRLGAAGGANKA